MAALTDQIKRIAILGIGGVGGYYGGRLAAKYPPGSDKEIIFIARGENEKVIRENGLRLITPFGEQIIHPAIITHDPKDVGVVDLLVCAAKAIHLEESIRTFSACIGNETIIIPLQNGVDNKDRILSVVPTAKCWQGCTYIVSSLLAPGLVKETGPSNQLYFGDEAASASTIAAIESIFKTAGIAAKGMHKITPVIWSKFIFLVPIATLTTALDLPIGAILEHPQHHTMLNQLVNEIAAVASSAQIKLPEDIVQATIQRIEKLPFKTYSSMHLDHALGKKTELDSLTGNVVSLGKKYGVPTPVHSRFLSLLQSS